MFLWLNVIVIVTLSWGGGALAQTALSNHSFNSVINRTLSDERVLFFAETHFSQLSFENVGGPRLRQLRRKRFDCLFLERPKSLYQEAYDRFTAGETYEKTVLPVNLQLFGFLRSNPTLLSSDRSLLSWARDLGFRIVAMDDTAVDDVRTYDGLNTSESAKEDFLRKESVRNYVMALRVAASLGQGQCLRIVAVVGAWHIYGHEALPLYQMSVKSMPQFLQERGLKSVSYRLLDSAPDAQEDLRVYSAVFGRSR